MKKFILLLVLFGLLLTGPLLAQESSLDLTTEKELQDLSYIQKIEDFYSAGFEGRLPGKINVPIYYKKFKYPEVEKGAIIISTGRTEAALKYKELIYDLCKNGYSVYIHDHRGQGWSGRMTEDKEMGYVDDYQYYIDDMKTFYDKVVKPDDHLKVYLLAHSMGGSIGLSYLEQFPDDFAAAAFSSPMLGFSSYICPLARLLSGKTPKFAPGQTGYSDDSSKFVGNDVTGSEIRYFIKIAAYNQEPETKIGGASVQWLHQSCKMIKNIKRNIKKLETPLLILTGQNETVVEPKSTEKFIQKVNKAGKDCKTSMIDDGHHELLMEKDPQRRVVINKILGFYEKY
jgi:lysophospholipase